MADEMAGTAGGLGSSVCRDEAASEPTGGVCACGRPTELISVTVKPTTGGQFSVTAASDDSVDYLKLLVSQKLKVPKERICLLYRNRTLRDGTLEANQVVHGCQLILLPSVESGLMSHRPEQSVMQALENLSPSQVTEFLSGKAPLNLTVRLGEHMMLIQLQLSPAQRPRGGDEPAAGLRSQLDTRALTEASRNLTRTLKQLSSEVLTGGTDAKEDGPAVLLASPSTSAGAGSAGAPLRPHPGAIIESMHHHGKGVYSGTFSGTLNPSLQDRMGRPKRDISTIIHILNDLLCASPQYRSEEAAQGRPATAAGTGPQQQTQPPAEPCPSADENQATRGKVERLKLVLEERRQRRRQRRSQRSAPYTTSWSATSSRPEGGGGASSADADADRSEVAAAALVTCGGQSAV